MYGTVRVFICCEIDHIVIHSIPKYMVWWLSSNYNIALLCMNSHYTVVLTPPFRVTINSKHVLTSWFILLPSHQRSWPKLIRQTPNNQTYILVLSSGPEVTVDTDSIWLVLSKVIKSPNAYSYSYFMKHTQVIIALNVVIWDRFYSWYSAYLWFDLCRKLTLKVITST